MSLRKIKYTFASSNALLFLFLIFSIGLAEWTPAVASMPDDMVFLYDQPLKAENIHEIVQKIQNGAYTDTIFHGPTTVGKSAWIYIPGELLRADTSRNYLLTGYYDFTDLYKKVGGEWSKQLSGGYYMKFSDLSPEVDRVSFRLFEYADEIVEAYMIACRRNNDYSPSMMEAQLLSEKNIEQWVRSHDDSKVWFNRLTLVFWGVLLLTIVNLASRVFYSKSEGYMLFMLGNIFITINFLIVFIVEPSNIQFYPLNDPVLAVALADPTIIIGIGAILLSIRYFYKGTDILTMSMKLPFISFALCIIVSGVLFILTYFYQLFFIANAITYVFLTTLVTIIYLIIFIKRKSFNKWSMDSSFVIIFIGSLFFSFFSILGFALSLIFEHSTSYIGLFYLLSLPLVSGVSIYNVFVLLALNNQDFKEVRQAAAIKEKASKLEVRVMQNSLNPHFIFNSLNLIDYFIYKEELIEARKALYQFSDLLRTIIDKTSQNRILISEELKITELYLEIERSRKIDFFTYSFQVSEDIDAQSVFIPPLIIQPIVENAIKHGVLNREEEKGGRIDIIVSQLDQFLKIEINDNGIGFKNTKELSPFIEKDRTPFGLELTRRRLELFSKQSELHIIDLPQGGTSVIINIPF